MTRVVLQTEASECGLACLVAAAGRHGHALTLAEARARYPVSSRGMTLAQIRDVGASLGLVGRAVECDIDELQRLTRPSILHWGFNHFVVLDRVSRRGVTVMDPAVGLIRLSMAEVSRRFTGMALELRAAPDFKRRKERSPLRLSSLFRVTPAFIGGIGQALALSLLMQVFVLASPLYMQTAIDQAALKGDIGLLGVLALGFGLFAVFNVVAEALRGLAFQKLTAILGWDMTSRLYRHLLRLPLPWFQRRRVADTFTRFESIAPVRQLLANGLAASLIDGLLALVTLCMMLLFAPVLAGVVVAGFVVYALVRLASIPLSMRLGAEALMADVAEQGKRLETIRAIQTIKVMGGEPEREGDWSNLYAETVKRNQAAAHASIGFRSLQSLTDAIVNVVVIYLGVTAIIQGRMTIGVLYAFMAYRGSFTSSITQAFELLVQWKMLDLHSERIADIALTDREAGIDRAVEGLPPVEGRVELRNVSFAYSPHDPPVLQNVGLVVEPGEFVAIIGPSGGGKSTLLKLVTGLYPVSYGDILLDGRSLETWGPRAVRRALGVVMQDDELLSGSISQNVSFFDEQVDVPRIWETLRIAGIEEEVARMPMGLDTFVGDAGRMLSGGQKQRVLLARALYRRPKILVLDEATSHLDVHREKSVTEALKGLAMTRIIVAHRPETVAGADRVLSLVNGRLVPANVKGLTPHV
ncbi:peptidase domain-containing ABC transporter [Brevundimonas sp.]|uniref:peptidase domain-containing ABC transporter n=1 Tax=Brevundimonas sp. TaxID=1871086 RepID=UPI003F7038E8